MLSWGQKAAIDGGMSLESAILVSWDTAKQLFQGKRGHEAAVMRATVKALEALNTLECSLKDCGVEVDRLVAAKLGGKAAKKPTVVVSVPPASDAEELPLVVVEPVPPKKRKGSRGPSGAIVKAASGAQFKSLKAALVATYLDAPSLAVGLGIYRALWRLLFKGLPLLFLNFLVYGGLLCVVAGCAFPRLAARGLFYLASQIPGLMWHILHEFADEFSGQLFGYQPVHCPDSCFSLPTAAPDGPLQKQPQGLPAHRPPAQPPPWFLSGVLSVATALITTRLTAPAAPGPPPR